MRTCCMHWGRVLNAVYCGQAVLCACEGGQCEYVYGYVGCSVRTPRYKEKGVTDSAVTQKH